MINPINGTPAPLGPAQGMVLPGSGTVAQSPAPGISTASGTASTPANATGTAQQATTQSLAGTDTFLKLLVAQMRNQDPMQPMDDQTFISELAQFNTVEQLLNVKQSLDAQAGSQQAAEAMALLGKRITYTSATAGGNTTSQGVVAAVSLAGGQPQLQIGQGYIPLSAVTSVQETPAAAPPTVSGVKGSLIPAMPIAPLPSGG
ncbi:MAG TPA: flagellar hook capping FlgD N-terminal domain-containing protein [Chloroflexota bacterium]|nr:flagellar hook capping FlgD N-terminal domain-containing protein [Chloroflexota bacterium]